MAGPLLHHLLRPALPGNQQEQQQQQCMEAACLPPLLPYIQDDPTAREIYGSVQGLRERQGEEDLAQLRL